MSVSGVVLLRGNHVKNRYPARFVLSQLNISEVFGMSEDDITLFAFCYKCQRDTWHSADRSGRPIRCLTCKNMADKAQRNLMDFN